MDTNPVEHFKENGFTESIVQRIVYQAELNQLEFILRYAGFVPSFTHPLDAPTFQQPLDFRQLLFSDVMQLQRSRCNYKPGFQGFDPASFDLSAAGPALTVEIESAYVGKIVDTRRTTVRYKAEMHMGSFGTYSFEFGSLVAFQRLVKIVLTRGGGADHFDYNTNAKIAISDPFADG